MSQSVEIPEAAVEAAAKAVSLDYQNYLASMRVALAAALPYLAPAPDDDPEPSRKFSPSIWEQWSERQRERYAALAPAADGGLREALTGKPFCQTHEARRLGCPYCDADQMALDLLANHPAAPAVPQPVDREALIKWVGKTLTFEHFRDWSDEDFADAVLAVLAGEQEQVEK